MSTEDLERYEAEIELQLYKEYKDVAPMFTYVVETERRFYLANEVNRNVRNEDGRTYVELEMRDAWVWDMYRTTRFVASVSIVTFKDVNIEELPKKELVTAARLALGAAGEAQAAAWYEAHGLPGARTGTGAAATASSTSSCGGARARVRRGEDPAHRPVRHPGGGGHARQAAAAALAGRSLPRRHATRRARSASTWSASWPATLEVIQAAF